ncbi:poly [ADP-ribose] polymerase 2-like isoform X2 [Eurytemora carolleeae]|uniref:poly [ADP-ribose] polymerase 2-like isoform X2 n=1 Tax=Eurytemora carolleeae TaxID=1294199 RepID=UPI000C75D78E|nr:poly [ADP-ribose] polymerase 2-like isoform X2 [Eurytemora carolleeae]|eukprot:XP_023329193.1 poly [ADP-ribose] polymerase 2-like isoform X2 [Eurytemora affinis]
MGRKKPVKSKGDVGEENMVASGSGSEEKITLLPVNTKLIWQLQDKSDWSTYSTEISEALNSAAVLCKLQVDAEAGPRTKLVLNIKDMVQQAKSSSKPIRCLVEGEEGLVSWTIKETEKSLQPGIAARLNQVVDISSEVSLDGFKYDLVNMIREKDGVKESLLREKVVPTKFKKTGITGKISLCPTPAEEEEEEEEEVSPPKKSKKEKSNKSKVKSGEEAKEMKPVMKSFVRKGLAPVDPDCPHKDNYHVYTEGREVWDTMLNQTNIQNNNNKYYLIQLLKADSGNSYAVWMRWGRVGYKGQNSWTTSGSDLDAAKSVFTKKFQDKTKNLWEDRYSFEKYPGKYDMVLMDYSAGGQDSVDSAGSSGVGPVVKSDPESKLGTPVPDSTLEKRVQDLISLICDIKTMEQAVVEMEYDAEKAPLGKITTEQIRAGYQALKKISDCITGGKTSGGEITQACNDFYTRIPHEFGFKVPPIIRTHAEVKRKIELLEALSDIQVALKMLSTEQDTSINPIDRRYNQLKVDIKALDVNENERKAVEKSILNTHAPTHSNYTMEILDVFKINKEEEKSKFIDVGNTKLLYHGSRLSNWAGILGTGLRIAPPEAPVTGYMFGKGVYFADMSSKSANYCFTNRSQNIGLLLICEVALGKQNTLLDADYNADIKSRTLIITLTFNLGF